jgi:predicted phage terminase large subunit-like protein
LNEVYKQAVDNWIAKRQRARTDLLFLCNTVLNFPDVAPDPHGELIEKLQKFRGGTDVVDEKTGVWKFYKPACSCWELEGPKKRLFLWPRGHLKTTILTMAHTVQWVINYPDIRILVSTAIAQQAQDMLKSIKSHFQYNPMFRVLFPEYCPSDNHASDFGNAEEFTVPSRARKDLKEPTVSVTAIGKVISSYHYEVIKHSDIVDKENIKTEGGRINTTDHFKWMSPLLERHAGQKGWEDVEGTRYDFSDTYGTEIVDKEEKLAKEKRSWQIEIKSAYREDGRVLWPQRWSTELLEDELERMGPVMFAANYHNQPVPDSDGLAGPKDIVFFPRKALSSINLRYHATIDLHGMEDNQGNDSTVLNVSGFDNDGRMYLVELLVGRYTPFETMAHMFYIRKKYGNIDFKIEKDAHARVLLPFLKREMVKKNLHLMLIPIKRDTRTSKKQRIRGLQPWFKSGNVRILDDLEPRARIEVIQQIMRFSMTSHYHDDILDTMADQMQNSDGGVSYDLTPRTKVEYIPYETGVDHFLGFDEFNKDAKWLMDRPAHNEGSFWKGTGL